MLICSRVPESFNSDERPKTPEVVFWISGSEKFDLSNHYGRTLYIAYDRKLYVLYILHNINAARRCILFVYRFIDTNCRLNKSHIYLHLLARVRGDTSNPLRLFSKSTFRFGLHCQASVWRAFLYTYNSFLSYYVESALYTYGCTYYLIPIRRSKRPAHTLINIQRAEIHKYSIIIYYVSRCIPRVCVRICSRAEFNASFRQRVIDRRRRRRILPTVLSA